MNYYDPEEADYTESYRDEDRQDWADAMSTPYWIISVPGGYSTHSWERIPGSDDKQIVFDVVSQASKADRYQNVYAAEDDLWDYWGGNGTCWEVRP